jgi:hypothetical protein
MSRGPRRDYMDDAKVMDEGTFGLEGAQRVAAVPQPNSGSFISSPPVGFLRSVYS